MIRRFFALLTLAVCAVALHAEILTPVKWTSEVKMTDDSHGVMTFTATIDDGWHMYSTNLPKGGPQPLSITLDTADGVTLDGELTPSKAPHEQVDNVFHMKLGWWTDAVTLTQAFTATKPDYNIEGYLTYMVCNDVTCQAPTKEQFIFKGTAQAAAQPVAVDSEAAVIPMTELKPAEEVSADQLWAPVDADAVAQAEEQGSTGSTSSHSFWYIFIGGFLGGLLALLTPCLLYTSPSPRDRG